jgi:hypothetical protein
MFTQKLDWPLKELLFSNFREKSYYFFTFYKLFQITFDIHVIQKFNLIKSHLLFSLLVTQFWFFALKD